MKKRISPDISAGVGSQIQFGSAIIKKDEKVILLKESRDSKEE